MSTELKLLAAFLLMALFACTVCVMRSCSKYEYFTKTDPAILDIHAALSKVDPAAANKIQVSEARESYTINKRDMHLCIRDEVGEYFNRNMLLYVALHELAHVKCKSIGHTAEFHSIFRDLLKKAEEQGVYNSKIPPVSDYQDRCGTSQARVSG